MSLLSAFLKNIFVLFVGLHLIAFVANVIARSYRFILPETFVYILFMTGTIAFFLWGVYGTYVVLGIYAIIYFFSALYSRLKNKLA